MSGSAIPVSSVGTSPQPSIIAYHSLLLYLSAECVAGTKGCNKQIPATQANVDAKPVRRAAIPKQFCPPGLSACEVSGISLKDGRSPRSLSCIDTQNDIEACGECPFPGSDAPQGEDCTMMDGVDEVIVSRLAECVCRILLADFE